MSDARLRDLERAAAAGDADAAARYLHERMRGGLAEERVELLAYCLHPPACTALGWERLEEVEEVEEVGTKISLPWVKFKRPDQEILYKICAVLPAWAQGLRRWGHETSVRAVLAAARYRYPKWEELYDRLVKAGERLPFKKATVLRAFDRVEEGLKQASLGAYWSLVAGDAILSPAIQRRVYPLGERRLAPVFIGELARYQYNHQPHRLAAALNDCGDFHAVLAGIRSELVPWVLGWEDQRQEGGP